MNTQERARKISTGTFNITHSTHGSFSTERVFLQDNGWHVLAGGIHVLDAGTQERLQIALGLPDVDGESSGDLGPIPLKVPFAYFDHYKPDGNILHDAEHGTFEVTFIRQAEHLDGKFQFTSQGVEFKGNFNVYFFEDV